MEQADAVVTAISPTGEYLLITNYSNQGLTKIDITSGEKNIITTAQGAGNEPAISADGKNVIFRSRTIGERGLRHTAVIHKNIPTGVETQLIAPTRHLEAININGNHAFTKVNGVVKTKKLAGKASLTQNVPVISNSNLKITVTRNGISKEITPNGKHNRYIWVYLSPDATKILYNVSGENTYVCDLDGNIITCVGDIRGAQWWDNNTVVGMVDKDNGVVITSSHLKAVTLDGKQQILTDNKHIALYPCVTKQGSKIAFSTPTGEAFIINIKN